MVSKKHHGKYSRYQEPNLRESMIFKEASSRDNSPRKLLADKNSAVVTFDSRESGLVLPTIESRRYISASIDFSSMHLPTAPAEETGRAIDVDTKAKLERVNNMAHNLHMIKSKISKHYMSNIKR